MANITVLSEGGEERYPLEAAIVTLGRGIESDVRLKDIKASRRHCQIVREEGGFQVVDLSSGNGTYVNGIQVKQQPLQSGDKIQIGSTTITFLDAPEVAARPAESRPQPSLVPEPVPPPRKPVPAAAPAPAPPSPSSPKNPAATRKLPPVRSGISTRSAPVADGASAPRKGASPALLIVAGIGVVFLGVVGAILLSGSGDSGEQLAAAMKKLGDEARAAEKAGRFDEATVKYRSILSKIEGKDRFRGDAVRINDALREIGERKTLLAGAGRRFTDLKARAASAKEEDAAGLAREARQLLDDVGEMEFDWTRELKELADRLEKSSDPTGGRRHDFQSRKSEIASSAGLATEAPRYGEAIALWQAYSGEKTVSEENRQKASLEIASLNQKAKQELDRLKVRASVLEKDNKKAEAIEELKKLRARFRMTESAEDLESVIGQLEK